MNLVHDLHSMTDNHFHNDSVNSRAHNFNSHVGIGSRLQVAFDDFIMIL